MSYYNDVYLKRLNRFGDTPQSRVQGQREAMFEDLLTKSIYRVDFPYNNVMEPGLLERYKQDETQTLQYLLTRVSLNMPGGTILSIPDKDGMDQLWMIYWLEYIEASGYNRYVLIRINYQPTFTHEEDLRLENPTRLTSPCYFFGKRKLKLRDDDYYGVGLYMEDTNTFNLVMPMSTFISKGDYFEITKDGRIYPFKIVGYDVISTPGVIFVTAVPIYKHDDTPVPEEIKADSTDSPWLTGNFWEV